MWLLLLQCKLVGKVQEVCTSLSIEDSLNYNIVKATVLCAYELMPEAYREKFRKCEKTATQTYVEFAREKGTLSDKWCQASKVKTMDDLCELLLLEEYKNCLPERVVVYLNEQKVSSITAAAVLADEFALTHKSIFSPPIRRDPIPSGRVRSPKSVRRNPTAASEHRECFYCHEPGHLIAACPTLKTKEQSKTTKTPSPVGLIHTKSTSIHPVPQLSVMT